MSSYIEGQSHQLVDALEAHGFTAGDITTLGQNKDGVLDHLKLVLLGLAKIVRESLKLACDKPFNLADFFGEGWSVWKGPADSNGLEGEEDRDPREDNLSVIDWEKVIFETHLKEGDGQSIGGEENLRRAKATNKIQLGGKSFRSLWEDYQAKGEDSVLEKLRRQGVTRISFLGLVLRDPSGDRYVLCLYSDGSEWRWGYDWLGSHWGAGFSSASLASN